MISAQIAVENLFIIPACPQINHSDRMTNPLHQLRPGQSPSPIHGIPPYNKGGAAAPPPLLELSFCPSAARLPVAAPDTNIPRFPDFRTVWCITFHYNKPFPRMNKDYSCIHPISFQIRTNTDFTSNCQRRHLPNSASSYSPNR